jgi:hypothetical protein
MRSFSVSAKSADQWCRIWLDKYSDLLVQKEYPEEQRRLYWAVLRRYLEENPGNPRLIPVKKAAAFVASEPDALKPPLALFYEFVARSQAHLDFLLAPELPAKPPAKAFKKPRITPDLPRTKTGRP